MFSRLKADVAPIYRTEIDRHLFATASPRGSGTLANESARRQWLQKRWLKRFARWNAEPEASLS